ncbi:hypothetical protein CYY_003496 [Polysphondylium violaceum]|uniref:HEAT repeat-containing protein n=1 Tax=Polysphondylium violaceum TaxID=133409 RepID=A0A8J4Q6R3_9MYCE|nr:hypothetical protein CYY_003496 [Polysphondylium violaceum]
MSNFETINNIIIESFIQIKDSISQDSLMYMAGVIEGSESEEELRDQIKIFCTDFDITFDNDSDMDNAVDHLISQLKKKGIIEFSLATKPKSYLVCNVSNELSLDDPNLTMEQYLQFTHSEDPKVRLSVLRTMCPCKVKADRDLLWDRIMQMSTDTDPKVRYQAMHNLCDGSPAWREESVIKTLESMHNDTDPKIRRRIHNILTHYKHTGKWNIM